ncbi:MAG TPA: DUF4402 domain-containing protein [Chitinophagaceae bacterium]|nr:DUF4402 domain-containing protein [Chitinophagaceae bacterium]
MFLFVFSFLVLSVANGQQNSTSTASAIATATIVNEMAGASQFEDMNFTNVQSNNADQKLTSGSAVNSAASFKIISNSYAYSVTLPANDILLTKNGSADTMIIDSFNITSTHATSNSGGEIFTVGAVLTVNAFQAEGNYTAASPVAVTVNYN